MKVTKADLAAIARQAVSPEFDDYLRREVGSVMRRNDYVSNSSATPSCKSVEVPSDYPYPSRDAMLDALFSDSSYHYVLQSWRYVVS